MSSSSAEDFEVEEHRHFTASDLLRLNDLAKSENVNVVSKLISSWSDNKSFFGERGEGLWIARDVVCGEVIGVGGITICPTRPEYRRVRRFYISPQWRRRGVATALANKCIERAMSAGVSTVTCHGAASAMAPMFWESIGFEPVADSDITHVMHIANPQVDYTNGGVTPFGHSTQLRVFVDTDVLQYDEVWAAAGTWNDVFGTAPVDIVRVAGGVVTDLKRA